MSSVSFMRRSGGPSSNLRFAAGLLFVLLKDCKEGFLRNLHVTNLTHTFLTFLLFLQKFLLTGDITTITLGKYVFTHCFYRLSRNDFAADCRLDRDLK